MLDIKALFSGSITLCFFISSVLITTKIVPLTIYKMKLNSFSIKIKPNSRFLEFQETHEILSVMFSKTFLETFLIGTDFIFVV